VGLCSDSDMVWSNSKTRALTRTRSRRVTGRGYGYGPVRTALGQIFLRDGYGTGRPVDGAPVYVRVRVSRGTIRHQVSPPHGGVSTCRVNGEYDL
jgi:hypothetical protein